ncbi:MAG: hypothetical protein MRY79_08275 [Alphaproteobacteria bacterium]|nr:hypothetical protein [Alphaproteobacteria bacterium]
MSQNEKTQEPVFPPMPETRAEKLEDIKKLLRTAFAKATQTIEEGMRSEEPEYKDAQSLSLELHYIFRDTLNLMRSPNERDILQEEHISKYLRKKLEVADLDFLLYPEMKDDANDRLGTEWLYLHQINHEMGNGFMDLKESILAGETVAPQSNHERLMCRLGTVDEFLTLDARLTIC